MAAKQVQYTPLLERLRACKARVVVNVGGSGSSKSWSTAQLFILKLLEEHNKLFVVARKTMVANKRSSYRSTIRLLQEYGIYGRGEHNKSDHWFKYGDNEIWFMGLDEPTKVKSADEGINYIWMEEADEFTYDDYFAFSLQLRKKGEGRNQLFLSLNPIDAHGWIPTRLIGQEGVEVIHSTYLDNPLLDKEYVKKLEGYINEDENYYQVYTLGEWGHLDNLVYRNWSIVDSIPEKREAMAYGLDFGLVNPSVLVKVTQCEREIYLEERMYKPGMTNSEIIEVLSHEERGDIYADPTELQMIEEIYKAGYNIYPAEKSVKPGIDLCKRQTLNITKSSVEGIKEIRGYQHKKEKNGNVLDDPIKLNDHFCDAFRYGVYGLVDRFGFATAQPEARRPMTTGTGVEF